MSLTASATTTVRATPRDVLEFVLDLDRYRLADHKIRRISTVEGPDDVGEGSVVMWGKLRGMPPARDRQNFVLERWSHLTFVGAPRQPGRLLFDFVGTFDAVPLPDDSTLLTHAYQFTFTPPFRRLEKRLSGWLQDEIDAEVERISEILAPAV